MYLCVMLDIDSLCSVIYMTPIMTPYCVVNTDLCVFPGSYVPFISPVLLYYKRFGPDTDPGDAHSAYFWLEWSLYSAIFDRKCKYMFSICIGLVEDLALCLNRVS